VRILAIMEAASVTGPAKNLLSFCRWTQTQAPPGLSLSVATYCRYPDDGSGNKFVAVAREAGVPMHVLHERGAFDRDVWKQMAALVERVQPDLVQTHNVKSHFLWRASGLRPGRKWIAFHHGYTTPTFKMRLYNRLDHWSLRAADRVVTVCQAFAPELMGRGVKRDRIRILHNSTESAPVVSAEERDRLRRELRLPADELVMVTIGRLSREKAQGDFVDALARLRTARPELAWRAVIVGDGPERRNLETQIARLGLDGWVILAGFHARVAPFYGAADLFVLPSLSEGSPNVILEAMSARVPIVATAAGGTPEIVADGESALLVPPGAPPVLATALETALMDRELRFRLAEAAWVRAMTEFSPGRYREKLVEIYSETMGIRSAVPV
jgi:glycosyltransferase involved in cell wall biosynthesis